jgi:hypothetical protein
MQLRRGELRPALGAPCSLPCLIARFPLCTL